MVSCWRHIDSNEELYIERLREAVAIRSVSGWPEVRGEVRQMTEYAAKVMPTSNAVAEYVVGM